MSAEVILQAQGVRMAYRGKVVLDLQGLDVHDGEVLAVLGPSGSGKSTLLRILGLLEPPDAGSVFLGGKKVTTRSRQARKDIPLVFQDPYLFRGTVRENVGYGLRLRRVQKAKREERVTSVLATVGLGGLEDAPIATLSGGEAQRVALARALVLEPRILLLDEPLASLDAPLARLLTEEFARVLRESGTTAVWVTHDQEEAAVVADRVVILREGRIAASGPVEEVFGLPPDAWVASFVGVTPPLHGEVTQVGDGLVHVECGKVSIAVAGEASIGTRVRLGIRPEDVLIFESTDHMPRSSARNTLRGHVTNVRPRGATFLLTVAVDGIELASSVSRAAVAELELVRGAEVLVAFKATAVRMSAVTIAHSIVELAGEQVE